MDYLKNLFISCFIGGLISALSTTYSNEILIIIRGVAL